LEGNDENKMVARIIEKDKMQKVQETGLQLHNLQILEDDLGIIFTVGRGFIKNGRKCS
jgi:hypothetical protein